MKVNNSALFLITPFIGGFVAWKLTGSAEVGIFLIVGGLIINGYYLIRKKN